MRHRRNNQTSSSKAFYGALAALLAVAVLAVMLFLCGCLPDLYANPYALGDLDFGPLLPGPPEE